MDRGALPCGYCLKASTSLRHGRIQQVLSVAFPVLPSGLGSESVMMSLGGCVMLVFEIQDYDAE